MSDTIIMYENGKAIGGEGHPTNADEITFDNTGTDLVSEEVESAIKEVNAKLAAKAKKTDIATVESGTTASRAYRVGELVYVRGTLYRVKTAIASGATFTVGTNIEVANVSNAIKNATPYMGNMAPISANTIDDFFQNFKTNILKKCYVGQGFIVTLDWSGHRTFLMQGTVQSSTTIIFISTTPYDSTQNWCVNAGTTILKAAL